MIKTLKKPQTLTIIRMASLKALRSANMNSKPSSLRNQALSISASSCYSRGKLMRVPLQPHPIKAQHLKFYILCI